MILLVCGNRSADAGKTTFSIGLLERTNGVGFKPRAGNDRWFDYDAYREAVDCGRLYGKDAKRLAAVSQQNCAPEDINPVHRLWEPAPAGGTGLLGRADRRFLVDRVGEEYIVNGRVDIPVRLQQRLPLADAISVDSLTAANEVMERYHLPAIRSLRDDIESADVAVIESYGDIAIPLRTVDYDAVAVVEPARARLYSGDRFQQAHQVAIGGSREGYLEEPVDSVVELLDAKAVVELPPLRTDERASPAAIQEAYEPAYAAMVSQSDRNEAG